jgi:hypothetical protein
MATTDTLPCPGCGAELRVLEWVDQTFPVPDGEPLRCRFASVEPCPTCSDRALREGRIVMDGGKEVP